MDHIKKNDNNNMKKNNFVNEEKSCSLIFKYKKTKLGEEKG
jgi:hypothetical protein